MKILIAASECVPFIKTGGLADVIGALPKEQRRFGDDVRVIVPYYQNIPDEWRLKAEHVLYFYINLGWRRQYCGVERIIHNGITYYFIDNEFYFRRPYVYGLGGDEGERFAFFSRAVLEMLPLIDFIPDIIHCHDWQTGLIPALLKIQYATLPLYKSIKTVFTIHNLQYQGIFPIHYIEDLLTLGNLAYTREGLEFYGQCSFMKGGLSFADYITTVSPTYAQEIQTPFYGERMDGLLRLRANALEGILNGIDMEEYNPCDDPLIDAPYTVENYSEGKAANKEKLQERLGLEIDPAVPLIGIVTRFSGQKGLDLIERVLPEIMDTGAQMAVLGMGDDRYVDMFKWAQWKYAGRIGVCIEMNHALAHQIYAGSDLFLMPSKFEPCGLSQMIALRYGTLPIVRETGGLRDTVLSYNRFTGEGNGFTFQNYNAHDMLYTIRWAVAMFKEDSEMFGKLIMRAMTTAYGWNRSAQLYRDIYLKIREAVV